MPLRRRRRRRRRRSMSSCGAWRRPTWRASRISGAEMFAFLPLVLLIFNGVVVIWDVVLTGRMAQVRTLPRPFVFLTGLAGFLLLPALVIHLPPIAAVTGRSWTAVHWLCPVAV